MKALLRLFTIAAILLVGMGLDPVSAMTKYTDRQTALALAKVLDKGQYGRFTIASTYVQNASAKDYYLSVILSNGSSKKWYISDIYKWSREGVLHLSENRTLLFLDGRSTRFVVLDKNAFHRLAMNANVYVKTFPMGDPLEGQSFRYHIKAFNLISPQEKAFGRDETGSKYRYIIDFFNGQSELLTYENAYKAMREQLLLKEKAVTGTTFGKAYQVTKILAYPKGSLEDGVAQFGIEIQFDRPVQLKGENFPVEVYETKDYNPRTKNFRKEFVMDITIPNAEKFVEVQPIDNLEYLYNIRIVKNPNYPKRLLLRAGFNANVLDIPPVVYKNSDNSVYVNFFSLIDQSVLTRNMLLEDRQLEQLEKASKRQIRVKKALKTDSDYGRAFIAAMETEKQAASIRQVEGKIQKLLAAIKQFKSAALFADSDKKLYTALQKQNELRETVITLTVQLVTKKLDEENFGGSHVRELMDRLDLAESFTKDAQIIESLDNLREQLIAAQAE